MEKTFENGKTYISHDYSDIERHFRPAVKEAIELIGIETFDADCYRAAMEKANLYFEVEAGGTGYVDLKRLAPYYQTELFAHKPEIKIISDLLEQLEDAPKFPITFYDSAQDMLDHREMRGSHIDQEEAREILKYAAELEKLIEEVKP